MLNSSMVMNNEVESCRPYNDSRIMIDNGGAWVVGILSFVDQCHLIGDRCGITYSALQNILCCWLVKGERTKCHKGLVSHGR